MTIKPDCRKCQWHANIIGSHHISCKHPLLTPIWKLPMIQIAALLGPATEFFDFFIENQETGEQKPAVVVNPHGIANGWASWPINFDRIWIDECNMPIDLGDLKDEN